MYFLQLLFLGPSGLGKTTVCQRLKGEMYNIIEYKKKRLPSTGVIESSSIFATLSTSLVAGLKWFTGITLEDEMCIIINGLTENNHKSVNSHNSLNLPEKMEDEQHMQMPSLISDSYRDSEEQHHISSSSSNTLPSVPTLETPTFISSLLKKAKQSMHWNDAKHTYNHHFRVADTGGQHEFMDLLPTLTVCPGVYLLFVNLCISLKDFPDMSYTNEYGETITLGKSTYTMKDIIMTELSSIYCMNQGDTRPSKCQREGILQKSKPIVLFVGTHKDKVSEDQVLKLDKELREIIEDSCFCEDIVEYFAKDQIIFALDNMNGGDNEMKKMQEILDRKIKIHFEKQKIPLKWLLFSIYLRSLKKKFIDYKDCLDISKNLMISDLDTVMWFLHHVGILIYFPTILPHLVILDVQVVFDSISKIIFDSMESDRISRVARENFVKRKRFSLKALTKGFDDDKNCNLILPKDLVAILKYLHIIAEIDHSEDEDSEYIMPVKLDNLSNNELNDISGKIYGIAPIYIRYKSGFVPTGVFPALEAALVQKNKYTTIRILKNLIEFYYEKRVKITLIYRPQYLELIINSPKIIANVYATCCKLRLEIREILEKVHLRMNYREDLKIFNYSLLCPSQNDHFCDLVDQSDHINIYCTKCGPKSDLDLDDRCRVWFVNVSKIFKYCS